MGWTPGNGLGPQGTGRTSPIQAVVRPKYLGNQYGVHEIVIALFNHVFDFL